MLTLQLGNIMIDFHYYTSFQVAIITQVIHSELSSAALKAAKDR